jgi:hypothetical protein
MANGIVTILCSGFGLGLYIPGLLVDYQLKQQGIATEVVVLESLFGDDKQETVMKSKKAHHRSFSFALMSARMPINIQQSLDSERVDELLQRWQKDGRKDFIVFSGHWVHILDEYRNLIVPEPVNAEILVVDCDLPPSWKSLQQFKPDYSEFYREVWLYDPGQAKIRFQIPIGNEPPIPYEKRENRFLIHGGGWGMGTYQSKIPELEQRGFALDIVVYDIQEASCPKVSNRYYIIDPAWSPWHKGRAGRHEYPPFGEIKGAGPICYRNREAYHELFDISRKVKAIIGKPGAGTMMDSLAAATPLIMLEPFGEHERENMKLWERAGFGLLYSDWEKAGFQLELLRELHDNLLDSQTRTISYVQDYLARNEAGRDLWVVNC